MSPQGPFTNTCGCWLESGPCHRVSEATWLHLPFQAAELAEYTAKIALLEEARRRKEDEVEEWQHRVSLRLGTPQWVGESPADPSLH